MATPVFINLTDLMRLTNDELNTKFDPEGEQLSIPERQISLDVVERY